MPDEKIIVKDVMTPNPIVGYVPGTREEILKLLVRHNITGLPILRRSDKKFVGLINRQHIYAKPEEEQTALIMDKDWGTIKSDDDVKAAARLMLEKNITHLPVVETDGKLVGIVTPADLLRVVEKKNILSPVIEYVRSPCVPVYEETPLRVAAVIFRTAKISAMPVLNSSAKLVGIITDRDIFNLSTINEKIARSTLGVGNDEDTWSWAGLRNVIRLYYEVSKIELPKEPIKKIMVKKPVTVFEKTSIAEAAKIMRKNDYGQLPIRDSSNNLVGMIYELDLMAALIK